MSNDNGIHITTEYLNNLRDKFNCLYSEIFMGLYQLEKIDNRMVSLLLWSVEVDNYLPPKNKLMEYQAGFDRDDEILSKFD